MLKCLRVGVIAVGLFCPLGGVAAADPVSLRDVTSSTVPDTDGWHLTVSLTGMTINAVPNMAATAFTREGFVSAKATLTLASSDKSPAPVKLVALRLFVQLGCQINVADGINIGGDNRLGSEGTAAATGAVDAFVGEDLNPEIVVLLKPGEIKPTVLGYKHFNPKNWETMTDEQRKVTDPIEVDEWTKLNEGGSLERFMQIQDSEVKVDGCGGPVSVRLVVNGVITTERGIASKSIVTLDAYSEILLL